MATHYIRDDKGRVSSILTMADIFEYGGFIFEHHRILGPCKLKKNWEPAKREGLKFWKTWSEWDKLSPEEKEKTRVAG